MLFCFSKPFKLVVSVVLFVVYFFAKKLQVGVRISATAAVTVRAQPPMLVWNPNIKKSGSLQTKGRYLVSKKL